MVGLIQPALAILRCISTMLICAGTLIADSDQDTRGSAKGDDTRRDIARVEEDRRPNIVLIYADDVDCESVFGTFPQQNSDTIQFPNLKKLAQSGIRFSNFHVTTPVCGPSRACLYSGQYAHRNQCRVNDSKSIRSLGFTGGFHTFDPENELSIWMKSAGYKTAHVGKYLHQGFNPNYSAGIRWKDIVPPGWDYFEASLGSRYFQYPAYSKTQDKVVRRTIDGLRTDNEAVKALEICDLHLKGSGPGTPLFLSWSPIAAHIPGDRSEMRAPRHRGKFDEALPPEMKARLEQNVQNQVEEMKNLAFPDPSQIETRIKAYRNRMCAMLALDENIGRLRKGLAQRGMLKNTIFIFTSDHGFRLFQQRHYGKRLPYDKVTRVPFIIAGPGIARDVDCNSLLANIDIAPTLVDIACGAVPKSCDGISFANLIENPNSNSERDAILIENWSEAVSQGSFVPATYCCLRTKGTVYTEWATGGIEYFDLDDDPYQTNNLYPNLDSKTRKQLSSNLKSLRTLRGPPILANVNLVANRLCGTIKPVILSGYVESSSGIESVNLDIRCRKTGEFWDGSNWTRNRTRLRAKLDQPNGVVSRWTYALDSRLLGTQTKNNLAARDVSLDVHANDVAQGKSVLQEAAQFQLAFVDPETSVESVSSDKHFIISGQASDVRRVNQVRVAIKQTSTGKYWNGDQWQKEFHQFESEVKAGSQDTEISTHRWKFATDLRCNAERVTVVARAYGSKGGYDHTPAIKTVFVR